MHFRIFGRRIVIFLSAMILLHESCGRDLPTEAVKSEGATIATSLSFAHGRLSALDLTRILLEITGPDMTTIEQELTADVNGARGQVEVPVGKELTFKATAYKDATAVLQGSTTLKLDSGKGTTIKIDLDFLVPALILTPADSTVNKDDEFTVYIQARHVTDLLAFGVQVQFDETMLEVKDLGREDVFLRQAGGLVQPTPGGFTKNNLLGTVDIRLVILPSSGAVSGDGKVGRITFRAMNTGTTDLILSADNTVDSNLGLFDKNINLMTSIALGSKIDVN